MQRRTSLLIETAELVKRWLCLAISGVWIYNDPLFCFVGVDVCALDVSGRENGIVERDPEEEFDFLIIAVAATLPSGAGICSCGLLIWLE